MMKNGRSVKLNKKYFLVVLAMLGTQCILGINFVNAMQCEKEIEQEWASQNTHVNPDGSRVVFTGNDTHKMDSLDEVKSAIYDEVVLLTTQNPYEGQRGNWGPYTNFKSCEEHVNKWCLLQAGRQGMYN